jgi:heptosyltransferase-2
MQPTKVLVIRFSSLGDVVLATAVPRRIKAAWPEATVDVLTRQEFTGVFAGNPAVSTIRSFSRERASFSGAVKGVRAADYDVIVDLQDNLKSWFVRLLAVGKRVTAVQKRSWERRSLVWWKKKSPVLERERVLDRYLAALAPLGIAPGEAETELFLGPAPAFLAENNLTGKRLLGIAPGAKHATKRWTPQGFADAANRLAEAGTTAVLLGGADDRGAAEAVRARLTVPTIDLTGRTDLEGLKHVVSRLSLLLTNDSGLMHVAEAFRVPLVAVFGPTVREFGFAPYRSRSALAQNNALDCRPCSLHGTETCPLGHHKCMNDVTADVVAAAAQAVVNRERESLR